MRALFLTSLCLGALIAPAWSPAQDSSASVERAKQCDAMTRGHRLSDAQYKAYMRKCLALEGPPPDPGDNARVIERRCNTIANERQLAGQDRVSFMQSCRSKGG